METNTQYELVHITALGPQPILDMNGQPIVIRTEAEAQAAATALMEPGLTIAVIKVTSTIH